MGIPTTRQWSEIKSLFDEVLLIEPSDRDAFVEQNTDDLVVRAEVARMLGAHDSESVTSFLGPEELGQMAARLIGDEEPFALGEKVGGFRIVEEIGRGGMGVVYRARQVDPERDVALKVMRPELAGVETLRRFELESSLLARLAHPGIAHVYGTGYVTVQGVRRPYFAMELIEGVPITDYAREHGLSVERRLTLLARVCDAVQHAHQKGVIHRDLKPVNILVDRAGNPRVIDFGIAGETDAAVITTMHTSPGALIGTLSYMSPEQLSAAGDADTRTDVYALGVIAYEVLRGRTPFEVDSSNLVESVRLIERHSPESLGGHDRRFRGDIETVVSKAMARERSRRYDAASDFAADLRRCLCRQPVQARPPSWAYAIQMFTRRNRALVVGLVGVALVTALGIAGVVWQWRQTQHQVRMRDLSFRLLIDSPVNAGIGTLDSERADLHELARWLLEHSGTTPEQTIWLADQVAGRLDAHADYALAVELHRLAMGLCEHAEGQAPYTTLRFAREHAESLRRAGDPWSSERVARAAAEGHEQPDLRSIADSAEVGAYSSRVAKLRLVEAKSLHDLGRLVEAEQLMRELLPRFEAFETDSPPDEQWDVIATKVALARVLIDRGSGTGAEALALIEGVTKITESRLPTNIIDRSADIAGLRVLEGEARLRLGDPASSELLFRAALETKRRSVRADHPALLAVSNALGRALLALDRPTDAEVWLRDATDGADRQRWCHWRRWAWHADLGRCLLDLDRSDEAVERLESACEGLAIFDDGHFLRATAQRDLALARGIRAGP